MAVRPQQETPATSPTPKRRRIRWTRLKITVLVVGLIVLIAAGGIGWWLFSPLFFHNTASNANPFANSTPAPAATSTIANTPTVVAGNSGPVVLAAGKFIDTGANNGNGLANDHVPHIDETTHGRADFHARRRRTDKPGLNEA